MGPRALGEAAVVRDVDPEGLRLQPEELPQGGVRSQSTDDGRSPKNLGEDPTVTPTKQQRRFRAETSEIHADLTNIYEPTDDLKQTETGSPLSVFFTVTF